MKIQLSHFCRRSVALACSAIALATTSMSAADDAGALLARARKYLGKEAALDAVKSLHLLGTVTTDEGRTRTIEIVVRRPLQQRVVEGNDEARVIIGLNDYDAWRQVERAGQTGAGRVTRLEASDVRRLRANAWQYLYFYRDLEVVGGNVAIAGEAEIDGVSCAKVVFTHTGGISVERYIEKATGRLVMTKTDGGAETRESGVIEVEGVRFPKELTTIVNGKTSKLVLDEVKVNEEFADTLFEIPRPKLVLDQPPRAEVTAPVAAPATAAP